MNNLESLCTVILPTYNVEKYLDKCIRSVVNQSYKNLEILIVIDGATDSSYKIALDWQKLDSRINVIYQTNQGSGVARNTGLKNANGEFILFVDPDDWIDEDMISNMISLQKESKTDMVITKSRIVSPEGKILACEDKTGIKLYKDQKTVHQHYLELLGNEQLGAPTRKLYINKIIQDNKIYFPDYRRSQDIVFNYRYYDKIKSVLSVDDIYYNYMIDTKTFNLKIKPNYYKTLEVIYNDICKLCISWGVELKGDNYNLACTYFFNSVISNIESNVARKIDIYDIINNTTIQKITVASVPKRIDKILIRNCIINKRIYMLKILVIIRVLLKKFK